MRWLIRSCARGKLCSLNTKIPSVFIVASFGNRTRGRYALELFFLLRLYPIVFFSTSVEIHHMADITHHQIVIIGGGSAGITVAARLMRIQGDRNLDIAIIEPSATHTYQPALTLVGAGAYALAKTQRPTSDVIPIGVKWIKDKADGFDPDQSQVRLGSGNIMTYDYLVVCPGLCLELGCD